VEQSGVTFTVGAVPQPCKQQRRAFEAACLASWVRHFDATHDKELRLLQALRANINKSAATATGSLAGKPQE
jgi:hypothetical protein